MNASDAAEKGSSEMFQLFSETVEVSECPFAFIFSIPPCSRVVDSLFAKSFYCLMLALWFGVCVFSCFTVTSVNNSQGVGWRNSSLQIIIPGSPTTKLVYGGEELEMDVSVSPKLYIYLEGLLVLIILFLK